MLKLFTILFFAVFILSFAAENIRADVNCYGYPTLDLAPTETKTYGDVQYEYTKYSKEFLVYYENFIFKKKTAKTCHNLEFNLWFSNEGEKIEKPENVGLYLSSDSTFPKYGTDAKRRFKMLDGKKVIFSRTLTLKKEHRKDLKNYSEILSTKISVETLGKISETENLNVHLGNTKLEFTEKDKNAIVEMVKFINDIK